MDIANLYKLIHVVGLAMLFLGFGGILSHSGDGKSPKLYVVLHVVGLLAMLVAGFGRAARLGLPLTSGWILAKIGLWLLLGAMPVLARKGFVPRPLAWVVTLLVAAAAVYLAIEKPF